MKLNKINLFSRKGLQRKFPTAKIVRKKGQWLVYFPLPKDFNTNIISVKFKKGRDCFRCGHTKGEQGKCSVYGKFYGRHLYN